MVGGMGCLDSQYEFKQVNYMNFEASFLFEVQRLPFQVDVRDIWKGQNYAHMFFFFEVIASWTPFVKEYNHVSYNYTTDYNNIAPLLHQ